MKGVMITLKAYHRQYTDYQATIRQSHKYINLVKPAKILLNA